MAEKTLKLYKASANFTKKNRFPTPEDGYLPLEIGDFTFDAKRMGGAPTIQCTIMYHRCLDDEWSDLVFTEFRGERYYLRQTPSSSKDNKDARWKHEAEFVAERVVLDNIYFFDVVAQDEIEGGSAPVSNSTEFTFFGTISEFVGRLNASLRFSEFSDKYEVKINAEYQEKNEKEKFTTGKLVTFTDKFFSQALQEIYNVYELYYYFKREDDKTIIYIADYENTIKDTLEYGALKSLISVKKDNANYKPINRICGRGSEDNIPYYYPNPHRKGEIEPVLKGMDGISVEKTDNDLFYLKLDSWDKIVGSDVSQETAIIRYEGLYMKKGSFDLGKENSMYELAYNPLSSLTFVNFLPYATTEPLGLGEMGIVVKYVFEFNDESYSRKLRLYNISNVDNFQIVVDNANISYPKNATDISCYGRLYLIDGENRELIGSLDGTNNVQDFSAKLAGTYEWYVMYNFSHLISSYVDKSLVYKSYSGKINIEKPLLLKTGASSLVYKNNNIVDTISTVTNIDDNPYEKYGFKLSLPNIGLDLGAEITQKFIRYWQPQKKLQSKVYIISENKERFYPAKNYPVKRGTSLITPNINIGEYFAEDTYLHNDNYKDDDGNYYDFENPYLGNNPYEHIIDFPDIKPSIERVVNEEGLRIDMFSEFAYDDDDNNFEKEYSESGNDGGDSGTLKREHPYFFGKLRKLPFNLFDHAIENGEMTVAMTNGKLGSCKFIIHVGEETQKNLVQVNSDGTLKRDEHGNVLCGREIYANGKWQWQNKQTPQDKQNDTRGNEVWVALAKDTEAFPSVMPYAKDGEFEAYRPTSVKDSKDGVNGDTFVLLNIHLPQAYIDAAEEKLTKETLKYMAEFNKERFNFAIDFSRIFLAENPTILEQLNENARITVRYNEKDYDMYISGYSYKMSANSALPEIKVDLADTLTTSQGVLQNVISEVKASLLKK